MQWTPSIPTTVEQISQAITDAVNHPTHYTGHPFLIPDNIVVYLDDTTQRLDGAPVRSSHSASQSDGREEQHTVEVSVHLRWNHHCGEWEPFAAEAQKLRLPTGGESREGDSSRLCVYKLSVSPSRGGSYGASPRTYHRNGDDAWAENVAKGRSTPQECRSLGQQAGELGAMESESASGSASTRSGSVGKRDNSPLPFDAVNPRHYRQHKSGIECIQITEHMGFNLGNAVKYIWRADLKNDAIEDLRKAKWYIDRELMRRGHLKITKTEEEK